MLFRSSTLRLFALIAITIVSPTQITRMTGRTILEYLMNQSLSASNFAFREPCIVLFDVFIIHNLSLNTPDRTRACVNGVGVLRFIHWTACSFFRCENCYKYITNLLRFCIISQEGTLVKEWQLSSLEIIENKIEDRSVIRADRVEIAKHQFVSPYLF